jgi:hypothetical protein
MRLTSLCRGRARFGPRLSAPFGYLVSAALTDASSRGHTFVRKLLAAGCRISKTAREVLNMISLTSMLLNDFSFGQARPFRLAGAKLYLLPQTAGTEQHVNHVA